MEVPRDLLIFWPFTVRKPWTKSLSAGLKPAPISIAGQNPSVDAIQLVVPLTLATTFGYSLPSASGRMALISATGIVERRDMIRYGLVFSGNAELNACFTTYNIGGGVWDGGSATMGWQIIGADLTIAVAGTITWTANHHLVTGDGAAVTVDATTGIAAGEVDRQPLRLVGGSDTNTVTLAFAGNVNVNGAAVLGAGHVIDLEWDLTNTEWIEVGRSH